MQAREFLPVLAVERINNDRLDMTTDSGKPGYLELAGLWPPTRYRVRRVAAIVLAISPPIACAFLAHETGRWDLFERSGSITIAIGLLLASRRYIHSSALELAVLNAEPNANMAEILEDIFTAKLGLALSLSGRLFRDGGSTSAGPASPTCSSGHCLPLATSVPICTRTDSQGLRSHLPAPLAAEALRRQGPTCTRQRRGRCCFVARRSGLSPGGPLKARHVLAQAGARGVAEYSKLLTERDQRTSGFSTRCSTRPNRSLCRVVRPM